MIDDTDKRSKSSNDLENVYDRIQNLETTGSDYARDDNAVFFVVNSYIQRIVLSIEETTMTQQVSHRPIKCQSPS